jgi:hypothetical protein
MPLRQNLKVYTRPKTFPFRGRGTAKRWKRCGTMSQSSNRSRRKRTSQIPSLGLRPQARFGGQPPEGRALRPEMEGGAASAVTDEGTGSPCRGTDFPNFCPIPRAIDNRPYGDRFLKFFSLQPSPHPPKNFSTFPRGKPCEKNVEKCFWEKSREKLWKSP